MTEYIINRKERLKNKEISDYALFGQFGGLLLILIGYSRFVSTINDILSTIYRCLVSFGIVLFILGVVCPSGISLLYKAFSLLGNAIGEMIFSVILTVIYFVLVFPVGVFMKREKRKCLLLSWDDVYTGDEVGGFVDCKNDVINNKSGIMGTFINLTGKLIGNGHSFLLPVVVLLLAIGIILFFVSSSVMAPFIYTLF